MKEVDKDKVAQGGSQAISKIESGKTVSGHAIRRTEIETEAESDRETGAEKKTTNS